MNEKYGEGWPFEDEEAAPAGEEFAGLRESARKTDPHGRELLDSRLRREEPEVLGGGPRAAERAREVGWLQRPTGETAEDSTGEEVAAAIPGDPDQLTAEEAAIHVEDELPEEGLPEESGSDEG